MNQGDDLHVHTLDSVENAKRMLEEFAEGIVGVFRDFRAELRHRFQELDLTDDPRCQGLPVGGRKLRQSVADGPELCDGRLGPDHWHGGNPKRSRT